MSAAAKSARRRMGITTLITAIFIVASLVWATYNFIIVQSGAVRQYEPHYEYDDIPYWPYQANITGGRTNWFENINYTSVPLDMPLPDDLLDQLDDIIFTVAPADPPQLWRIGAYDEYDGSNWGKTLMDPPRPLDISDPEIITIGEATNEIYTVAFNATAGATVGSIEIPSLFPEIRVIEDSFMTYSIDGNGNPYPDPGRLLHYDLETDAYGTLLFTPVIQGTTGEEVIVTFQLTYETQDINNVRANAHSTVPGGFGEYLIYPSLSTRVTDNISQFEFVGNDFYEKAMAVQLYFQSKFEVRTDAAALQDRPDGQEVTDWFLERGGGLPMDFATAYCVFMRYLGVPARLALGYAVGDRDPVYDVRTLKVRHMTFWAEVFIPMSGSPTGGEWIQVIPAMLPSDMGGGEDPTNTPIPNVQLLVWPTNGQPWEQIGVPFGLSAAITIDGVPVTTPESITFFDETDSVFIGVATIGQPPNPPIANVTHTFPVGSSVDYHIIAASWTTSTLSITNRTSIYAVGTPDPYSYPMVSTGADGFIVSETRELNVSQGIDTHIAFWNDTIHVYGTMKVGGVPVNSSNHDNRNIGIYWDNSFMGNATIDEYGYYDLDIYIDPLDLSRMTIGTHEVWSWYLGDWDQYGIPRLNPARSSNNSTVTVWGRVGFDLYVFPTDLSAGGTLYYDGIAYLLNGTLLPMGQQVGVFFSTQANTTQSLNSTGGFSWSYVIPISQPDGTYFAYANWSSPWPLIEGNWSISIPVNVGSSGTQLSIFALSDPLYVSQNITIAGYLTHVSNGTGIGGRWVEIYWNNGSNFLLGTVLTASDGYYELNYTVLESDEGPIEYWSSFTSVEPTLASSESVHLFTNVKKLDVSLDPIFVTPDPVFLLQPVDIQGNLSLPEAPLYYLVNEWVDFWLQNSTGIFYIGSDMTNATGGYFYQYTIPIGQATETVYIWANYTSPYYTVYDGESLHEALDIQATGTLISIQEDFTTYYLNETILLYGTLQFSNGTPIQFETVYIHWVNASGIFLYTKTTDASGYYQMLYNCTPTQDAPGLIDVYVNWTSWTPIYDDAFSSIAPQIQLQRYYLEITITAPTQLYIDEPILDIAGVLSHLGGAPPLAGETVSVQYWDGAGWYELDDPTTNSTGGFLTSLGFATFEEGIIYFRAVYNSTNPLNNDTVTYFDLTRIKYSINLEVTINPNPVMQNETLTVHAYAYFAHNGSALSGATISIYWNNGTIPLPFLGNIITDGIGQGDLYYSGMSWDTVRTGIEVYGIYAGTVFHASNESFHNILTLNQWQTTFTAVNLPVVLYRLGETVVVTGNLEYTLPITPYVGATVELTLLGITRASDVTASDGSFTLSWDIPGTLPPGFYDLFIEFNSPYPWITDASFALPQIEVIAPGYLWPEFTVTPTTIYLDQVLNVTGRVTWDNGTPYANSPVDLYWGDYFGGNGPFVIDFLTDGSGRFSYLYPIPDDLGLVGPREVWAYIDPAGYATFGESPRVPILIDIYAVSITTAVDLTTVYLGGTLTFSGTLQFVNGTPLVGYNLEIWWGGDLLTTITISDPVAGAYSYVHPISYSNRIGVLSGSAVFSPPSIAWGASDTSNSFEDVTVLERVDVFMDPEPVDNTISRGDTLVITGYVLNDGGFAADGVTVEALVDGAGTLSTDDTAADGRYSISLQVPTTQPSGSYIISVRVTSIFHELRNGPTDWTILVYIGSRVYVQTNQFSLMPGETFNVTLRLEDDDGAYLHGEWVAVYLGSTHITDVQLINAQGMEFILTVPLSWDEGDGYYEVLAEYNGALYINPDSSESVESIHIFNYPIFSATPSRVNPGQAFNIEVTIQDSEGNPVRFRPVRLNYNGTDVYPYITDTDGRFRHPVSAQADGTVINFRVTLLSTQVGNIQSNTFTINIQTTGGNPLQGTDLLLASILLVGAVVAVLAYLYIVRGMFRSPVISRGIDIPTKLRNIKKLADSGKYGASITLAYRTFEQMCGTKMGSERGHSETAREFLDRVLQAIPLDGATVEQFVQTYEEARFSHHEMTRERYEEAVRIFTDLYPRIDSAAPVEKE